MVKQTLIALLAGGLVLSAVACGGQAEATATADRTTPARAATPTPPPDAEATVAAAVAATIDALPTPSPTPAGQATQAPTASTTGTPSPVPTATPTRTVIVLEEQLPRDVYQEFHNDWYVTSCPEPPLDDLGIARQWSGSGPDSVDIAEPSGTYFLIVRVVPNSSRWHLTSVYRAGSRRWESLRLSSTVPEELFDTQKWCTSWSAFQPIRQLDIDATGVEWTLSLVTTGGRGLLTNEFREALGGYYGVCPPESPEESLRVVASWSSDEFGASAEIPYTTLVPHTYLVLSFQPSGDQWHFDSVRRSGDWSVQGPAVSSESRSTMDSTSVCPQSSSLHTLEVESSGGDWTVWLVGVPTGQR